VTQTPSETSGFLIGSTDVPFLLVGPFPYHAIKASPPKGLNPSTRQALTYQTLVLVPESFLSISWRNFQRVHPVFRFSYFSHISVSRIHTIFVFLFATQKIISSLSRDYQIEGTIFSNV
jgi:hypothetical protein